jgi:hypothetical protein
VVIASDIGVGVIGASHAVLLSSGIGRGSRARRGSGCLPLCLVEDVEERHHIETLCEVTERDLKRLQSAYTRVEPVD